MACIQHWLNRTSYPVGLGTSASGMRVAFKLPLAVSSSGPPQLM